MSWSSEQRFALRCHAPLGPSQAYKKIRPALQLWWLQQIELCAAGFQDVLVHMHVRNATVVAVRCRALAGLQAGCGCST